MHAPSSPSLNRRRFRGAVRSSSSGTVRSALVLDLSILAAALAGVLLSRALPASGSPADPRPLLLFVGAAALEHPARARILDHLRVLPGDHFRSIARTLGMSVGEARHHLSVLLRQGKVREERSLGRCRYYLTGGGSDRNETFGKFWTFRDLRLRILSAAQAAGGVTPSELARSLGISRQLAGYHLRRLVEMGYLRREHGRYYP